MISRFFTTGGRVLFIKISKVIFVLENETTKVRKKLQFHVFKHNIELI
jgi:hypothetical protein